MWVKICGITRQEDALHACELGADAVGFVFTGSPRRVSEKNIGQWIHTLSGVEKVGVFTDENVEDIMRTCLNLGLGTVQLHCSPSPSHKLLGDKIKIIYAMDEYRSWMVPDIPFRVLIDSSRGSGMKGSWKELSFPYILAGGLTPENVRDAVRIARPAGIDVSSGVEKAPGVKDKKLMERFIREAKL
jgi:phosphoribosylanthranilate isomerase